MMVIECISQDIFHGLKRKWAETENESGRRRADTRKREKYHVMKENWKYFSENLTNFAFKSLPLVSTLVTVALQGATST